MKNVFKCLLVILSLVFILAMLTLPMFAEEPAATEPLTSTDEVSAGATAPEKETGDVKLKGESFYFNEENELVLEFKDEEGNSKKYNYDKKEWLDGYSKVDLGFDVNRMLGSLKYMGIGMLCIFIVIGVIIIFVYAIGYMSSKAGKNKKSKEENQE